MDDTSAQRSQALCDCSILRTPILVTAVTKRYTKPCEVVFVAAIRRVPSANPPTHVHFICSGSWAKKLAGIVLSVKRLATGWTVRGSNHSGGIFSAPVQTGPGVHPASYTMGRHQLKSDGTRAETRFLLSAKRTRPFKSAGASVQSATGSRGVRISGSNAGYTMFRGSVKGTACPLHSPVSPSLPLPSVTVCHHISTEVYRVFPGGKAAGAWR